jgi:hypothetical protein
MKEQLFSRGDLYGLLQSLKNQIKREIDELDQNVLLKANEVELSQYFIDRYRMHPPRLIRESWYADEPREIDIEGQSAHDFGRGNRRYIAKGTRIVIHVPYEGDMELFKHSPSNFSLSYSDAEILESELRLVYDILAPDQEHFKQKYEQEIANIEQNLHSVRRQVEEGMQQIPEHVASAIAARKQRLLQSIGFVETLGLPVRRSGDQVIPVSLPKKRRPSPVPLPQVSQVPYDPIVLADLEYDYILHIIENITIAIERSPSAFRNMFEEHLRDHILIQLNGHYEGSATGETFNSEGKTDILVRVKNKNIFIGECKFWSGAKVYLKALDQLFGYTCWSDTKAAIIMFNRKGDHTKVIETLRSVTPNHGRFKRELQHKSQTHLRYLFRHPEDEHRDIYVAVLAINFPIP